MPDNLKILAFTNMTASHKWRLSNIATRLNHLTPHEMYVTPFNSWNEKIVGANIVVVEMLSSPDVIKKCKDQGAKVIYEADDASIDSYGRERKNLQHNSEYHTGQAIETVRMCDAITVTNKRLADNYARFTDKPIYVLPNYMDYSWYGTKDLRIVRNSDEVRIGWFGSKGHFEDLKMVLPAIEKVVQKYPHVRFIYCGYGGMSSDRISTEAMWGEDVFKGIPRDKRELVQPVNEDLWPVKHRLLDLDIGICPLIDDEFNHCKTPIKWMEYGVLGTPAVCSPTIYGEHFSGTGTTVHSGQDGIIADSLQEWEDALCMLIENKEKRRYIGQNAKRNIEKVWNLDDHWKDWEEVYKKVLAS